MNAITNFMKRNYKIILIVFGLSITLWSFMPKKEVVDPGKDKALLEILTYVLREGHYSPAAMDDTFSKGLYKAYLKELDPSKRFFLQSDISDFSKYENQLDDQIKKFDLTFFELTYNRLQKRLGETRAYYKYNLSKPFDYTLDESFNTDSENQPFASNVPELMEKWKNQLKLSTLSSLNDKLTLKEKLAKGSLNEIGDDSLTIAQKAKQSKSINEYKNKSYEELEKENRATTLKSLDEYFKNILELERKDWFNIFVNCIAERFDPHTSYFAPEDKEKFDVSISGTLEGIGAKLQKKDDYTEITELISGGPAWKGKELEAGDLIMKVAQKDKEPVDILGMKIDDVVKMIKGKKGTEVTLTVKKLDGSVKLITILRDIVEIEETYVKSSIVEKNGTKYGVIYLPKFYINFESKVGRDAGKDMALEVDRLKKAGVQGIILDVRDDGGGSLKTVVDIAGLFITEGPIVQVSSSNKKKEILFDRDDKIAWEGPLVIMVNSFSASASEILAAAIQDYKRGVVIGSKQTYGKGTVQQVIDLNQFNQAGTYDMGALKTTIQKFYRIDGGSTQLEGVKSDVVMPDRLMYLKMGERDSENAMPWDKIEPAQYKVWTKQKNFDLAIANSKNRIEKNDQFKLIQENAKWIDDRNKDFNFSLNMQKYKAEEDQLETELKKFKAIRNYKNNLKFTSLPYELEITKTDLALKDKRKNWHESLSKDLYVEEGLNILDDLNGKQPEKTTMVVKVKPKNSKVVKL
jgi:carboxyl-terminal processing protease